MLIGIGCCHHLENTTAHIVRVLCDEAVDVPAVDRSATPETPVRVDGLESAEATPPDRIREPT